MSKIDDGGSAFPVIPPTMEVADQVFPANGYPYPESGMSIRDYFAGQALAGEFASQSEADGMIPNSTTGEWMVDRARLFYRMADAMLAARKAGGE